MQPDKNWAVERARYQVEVCGDQLGVERERNQVFVRIRDILLSSLAYRYYRHTGCNCQEYEQEDFVPEYFYLESEIDSLK